MTLQIQTEDIKYMSKMYAIVQQKKLVNCFKLAFQ